MTYSQEFKERHIKKLENLGIQYKTEYSFSQQATKDLHQVLHYDYKRRAKNTVGTSLFTLGIGGLIGGMLMSKKNQYDRHGFGSIAAGGSFLVGAAGIGTSIPIFISAGKTRKKRDQLKLIYQQDSIYNTSIQQAKFLSEN